MSLSHGEFASGTADRRMTLDQLSQAFSELLHADVPAAASTENRPAVAENSGQHREERRVADLRSVIEAMLFVGHAGNEPIASEQIAAQLPQSSVEEIDAAIAALSAHYDLSACPYAIVPAGLGYRLTLRQEYSSLRDRFYGRLRAARLSAAAVEVLALVAYHEPLAADDVSRKRGIPSGHILNGLVRRQLLRLETTDTRPKKRLYFTTRRFLKLFRLRSLQELPRSENLAQQ